MTLTAEKLCLAVVVAVVTSGAADATFFTYPEWDALTTAGKSAYIAGAFDSLEFFRDQRGRNRRDHALSSLSSKYQDEQ